MRHNDKVSLTKKEKEELINQLDQYQKKAFDLMSQGKNIFITGEAGSGKSLLLKTFASCSGKKVLKVAPTGVAALNIGGVTIHSAFGYDNIMHCSHNELIENGVLLSNAKKKLLNKVDAIVIDEISMVRSDVLDKVDAILRIICKSDKPFANKQMIFIGDPFQLTPITREGEEDVLKQIYGGLFFYNCPAYKQGDFEFVELKLNHRQNQDKIFRSILNNIREGDVCENDLATLNKNLVKDEKSIEHVLRLFATRKEVDDYNHKRLALIKEEPFINEAEVVFKKNENMVVNFESHFMCPRILNLKTGALVMFVHNDERHRWVNGTIGEVVSFVEPFIKVKVKDRTYNVEPVEFSQKEALLVGNDIVYTDSVVIRQYPLMLSYAVTIHKSQGLTYDEVACDLSKCFVDGQGYVALSRVTSLKGLHLIKPVNIKNIRVNLSNCSFFHKLKN